jgi:hypothetical protein
MNESGSVFTITIFILALAVGGLCIYVFRPLMSAAEDAIPTTWGDNADSYVSTGASFAHWLWLGLPVLILLGLVSWFLVNMQRSKYEVVQ